MWQFFELAKEAALAKSDARSFLVGCVAIRADGVIVRSTNGRVQMLQEINKKKSFPLGHAEYRISRKIDRGATIYVCRTHRSSSDYLLAKPCPDCERRLRQSNVKKIYYTIDNNHFDSIVF